MLIQFVVNGLVAGCVYSLIAIGFGLIYTTTKVFHIAHGAIYTLSAYIFYSFYILAGINIIPAFLISILLTGLLGIIIEKFIYSPLEKRKASSGVILIASLGCYTLVVNLIALFFGNEVKVLSPGVSKTFEIGQIILTQIQIYQILAFIIIIPLLFIILLKTRIGKIIRGIADNPVLISVLGTNVKKIRLVIFAIGSSLAGIAACFVGLDVGIEPHGGINVLLIAFVAVIIGSATEFEGAIIGAFLIGLLQNFVVWLFSTQWSNTFVFLLLLVFLLIRPQGILGKRMRIEET